MSASGRPATASCRVGESGADLIDDGASLADGQRGEIGDGESGDFHGEAGGTQAPAVAGRGR